MPNNRRERLTQIFNFEQLIAYLRDELNWRIESDDFEELTFDYTPEELGIDKKNVAKIREIKRMRPLVANQPWGIFFVKFEPKRLPVVALRRILGRVVHKGRASANFAELQTWETEDLLFVSSYGESKERSIAFAHFSPSESGRGLPTLKVLGWDNLDTPLRLDGVAKTLQNQLIWPDDESDHGAWREQWRGAFTLRHREVINTSKELSLRLAQLARAIRDRILTAIEIETESGPLTRLKTEFQSTLLEDLDNFGFADTYAQTVTYGLLSTRITNPKKPTADDLTGYIRTNPLLKELMEAFLNGGKVNSEQSNPFIYFDEVGISEVADLLDQVNMDAVLRDFGNRNPQEDPVIHFYEHFLGAYDKKIKLECGVFYTPLPVVSFIVRSVDNVLRSEFGLSDGLADVTTWGEMASRQCGRLELPVGVSADQPFVQILDPATGTGTFLVETIDLIYKTLKDKWKNLGHTNDRIGELWNEYVPRHLFPRLHGYELMMAPYAIAHVKIGLKLYETGYSFASNERARIYLTNALEPASKARQQKLTILPTLAREAQAANEIKRKQKFTVVIGNPPYLGEAGRGGDWIANLMRGVDIENSCATSDYFKVDGKPLNEKNPKWLNDIYVRFTRFSQWLIERVGTGVHGFITNHSYIDNPTFRGMRWALLKDFDSLNVLDLHGNVKKKETSPDGRKDENIFDIEQGVAISLFVRKKGTTCDGSFGHVFHTDYWESRASKYNQLLANDIATVDWTEIKPHPKSFYLFKPFQNTGTEYYTNWTSVSKIFPINKPGIVTARDSLTVQWSVEEIWSVVRDFSLNDAETLRDKYSLQQESSEWKISNVQSDLRQSGPSSKKISPILYRPFDTRYSYYTGRSRGFICRPRNDVMAHMYAGENVGLIFMRQVAMGDSYTHFGVSRCPIDNRAFYSNKGIVSFGPLYLYPSGDNIELSLISCWPVGKDGRIPNIDEAFVNRISKVSKLIFVSDGCGDLQENFGPEDVLAYIYAVFHSPLYRKRYEAHLKIDFPRVPLPGTTSLFRELVGIGNELLSLHLLESDNLNEPVAKFIGSRDTEVGRVGWSNDTIWIDAHKTNAREGHVATKPGNIGFKGVSERVWRIQLGGYQVCHKWLNSRKGRVLSENEIIHYQMIVTALSETIRIMTKVDTIIDNYGNWPDAFQSQ